MSIERVFKMPDGTVIVASEPKSVRLLDMMAGEEPKMEIVFNSGRELKGRFAILRYYLWQAICGYPHTVKSKSPQAPGSS